MKPDDSDSPELARAWAELQKELQPGEDILFFDWRAGKEPLTFEERRKRLEQFRARHVTAAPSEGDLWMGPRVGTVESTAPAQARHENPKPEMLAEIEPGRRSQRDADTTPGIRAARRRIMTRKVAFAVVGALAAVLLVCLLMGLSKDGDSGVGIGAARVSSTSRGEDVPREIRAGGNRGPEAQNASPSPAGSSPVFPHSPVAEQGFAPREPTADPRSTRHAKPPLRRMANPPFRDAPSRGTPIPPIASPEPRPQAEPPEPRPRASANNPLPPTIVPNTSDP